MSEPGWGHSDAEVLALADSENRVFLTEDLEFARWALRHDFPRAGIVVLQLGAVDVGRKAGLINRVLEEHQSRLEGALTVIYDRAVRIRRRLSG